MIFIIFSIQAQEQDSYFPNSQMTKETGKLNENGYPIGIWKYYSDAGFIDYTINWEIHYIKKYYVNGKIKEEGTFIPETGVHIQKWIYYFKTGAVKEVIFFDEKGKRIQ